MDIYVTLISYLAGNIVFWYRFPGDLQVNQSHPKVPFVFFYVRQNSVIEGEVQVQLGLQLSEGHTIFGALDSLTSQ